MDNLNIIRILLVPTQLIQLTNEWPFKAINHQNHTPANTGSNEFPTSSSTQEEPFANWSGEPQGPKQSTHKQTFKGPNALQIFCPLPPVTETPVSTYPSTSTNSDIIQSYNFSDQPLSGESHLLPSISQTIGNLHRLTFECWRLTILSLLDV